MPGIRSRSEEPRAPDSLAIAEQYENSRICSYSDVILAIAIKSLQRRGKSPPALINFIVGNCRCDFREQADVAVFLSFTIGLHAIAVEVAIAYSARPAIVA